MELNNDHFYCLRMAIEAGEASVGGLHVEDMAAMRHNMRMAKDALKELRARWKRDNFVANYAVDPAQIAPAPALTEADARVILDNFWKKDEA